MHPRRDAAYSLVRWRTGSTIAALTEVWIVRWLVALGAFFLFLWVPSADAQPETLRVGTRIVRPFVFEDGGNLTGFSVDLWQEIAAQLNVRTEWITKGTVRDLLDATQANEVEVAISAISITEEREKGWDFSHPMFEAGLQILIPAQGGGSGLSRLASAIFNVAYLPVLGLVFLGIVVAANIVWFFERRQPDGLLADRSYFPGI